VTNPGVLLLDEPLGALDPESRENVQQELLKLHDELGITVLHVTHDFEEAIAMGNRVAVIGEGQLKQVGTPDDIFRRPSSEFVARFVMARNIFSGAAAGSADGTTIFRVDGVEFISAAALEGECYAAIRPEDIQISREAPPDGASNCLQAVVSRIVNKGAFINVTASVTPDITCTVTRHQYEELRLEMGQRVYLTFPASALHLFRD